MRSGGSGALGQALTGPRAGCVHLFPALPSETLVGQSIDTTIIILCYNPGLPPPCLVVKHLLAQHWVGGGMVYRKQGKALPSLSLLS